LFFRLINNVVTKEEGGYMDKLLERFLQYVSLDTQSKPGVRQVPSTEGQWKLLRLLQAQLQEMGLVNVTLSEKGTVMGTLPANVEGDIPAIGFISHVDTSPDFSGKNVNPQIVENYRGGDIALGIGDEVSPGDVPGAAPAARADADHHRW
jgi:tripeptide aminopeptidase